VVTFPRKASFSFGVQQNQLMQKALPSQQPSQQQGVTAQKDATDDAREEGAQEDVALRLHGLEVALRHRARRKLAEAGGHQGSSLKQADIKAACDDMGVEASEELSVVPVPPTQPVGLENIALVSGGDRAVLAKIWRHARDEEVYAKALERITGV